MLNEIKNHFGQIGGLVNIVTSKKDSVNSYDDIENYLGSQIPKDIKEITLKYQGKGFVKEVGSILDEKMNIPILGNGKFLEFGIFLTLFDSHYKIIDILKSNEDLFKKDLLPFAEATPGDYIAVNIKNQNVYFVSHDGDGKFLLNENSLGYFISLSIEKANNNDDNSQKPELVSKKLTNLLLAKAAAFKAKNN